MTQDQSQASVQELIDATKQTQRYWAHLFMCITKPAVEEYGKKGEIAAREGIRNLGAFRGREIGKWHRSEGLPLNMESLVRFWDTGGRYSIPEDETVYAPYDVQFQARHCPLYDAWKEEGWEWFGYWFCDEMHQEMVKSYNSDAIVEIHENLNKGDDFCGFRFMMVPSGQPENAPAQALAKKMQAQPLEYALGCLKQTVRCVGATYGYMAQAIVKYLGEKTGRDLIAKANAELGAKRGRRIKEELETLGKPITVKNILGAFDLPYTKIWRINELQSDRPYVAEVRYCPFAEVWQELGQLPLGALYCNDIYKSLFKSMRSEADVDIPECLARNGKLCRFEFKV